MTEKEPAKDEPEEKVTGPPRARQPDCEQEMPNPTVASAPAELPAPKTVQLTYQPTPPSRLHQEPPEEPAKKAPLVPPGDYEEDTDESPPVHFDDPEQDNEAAQPPADETTSADEQPSD